jgi:hypothetical protein
VKLIQFVAAALLLVTTFSTPVTRAQSQHVQPGKQFPVILQGGPGDPPSCGTLICPPVGL